MCFNHFWFGWKRSPSHATTEVMNNWEWLMCFQTSFGLSNLSCVLLAYFSIPWLA